MRQWSGVFVAAVVATSAVLGAQGNQSPANSPPADAAAPPGIDRQQPPLPPPAQAKANTVTIVGCMQDAPMITAAAPPAAAGAKGFYLNNAKAADAARDRPAVGTSGLIATGYKLDGDNAELTPHLNHQVRIVGTVQNAAVPAAGAAGKDSGPTLKVESVAMLSAKCDGAK
jgi:hypothetical protein